MTFKKTHLVVISAILLSLIVLAWLVTHPLSVSVKATQKTFTADEFIEIKATLRNRSLLPASTFWGTCGEDYDVFVDEKNVDSARGVCMIGPGLLLPGQKRERTFRLDLSKAPPGNHTFYFVFDDIRSNTIHFETTTESTITDCYNYTDDVTPRCKQILIHTNTLSAYPEENNARCLKIKDRFITNTSLKPIPSLSTTNCDNGESTYLVMNVPESDYEALKKKLYEAEDDAEIFTRWTDFDIIKVLSN